MMERAVTLLYRLEHLHNPFMVEAEIIDDCFDCRSLIGVIQRRETDYPKSVEYRRNKNGKWKKQEKIV